MNKFIPARKIICIVLITVIIIACLLIASFISLMIELSKLDLSSKHFSQAVNFLDPDKTLFVNTASWGLAGNHTYIFFSDSEKRNPDKDNDLIFDAYDLFYKVVNDELIIWTNGNVNYEPENSIFNGIKIQINYYPPHKFEEFREFQATRKELGLFLASITDGITPP